MSIVLERAKESAARIPASVLADLESRPLSKIMRRQTWPDHERAEYSTFEQALVRGTITKPAYADLLAQVLPVYRVLEARASELADDPIAGPVITRELDRSDAIAADLAYYAGSDAQTTYPLLAVSQEYIDRVQAATPAQYVAHHYTRYLADLSGGLMIAESLRKAWPDLDGKGLDYYNFTEIPDPNAFKNSYRASLDSLPVDATQKREIIDEVLVAYEFNIVMVNELADKHLRV